MNKPKIFVSCHLFNEALELFQSDFELVYPAKKNTETNLEQLCKLDGVWGVIVGYGDLLNAANIEKLPRSIKAICTYSVGTNNINLDYAAEKGISVINTPDVLSESCADTAFLLMLGAARRSIEGNTLIRENKWDGWQSDQLLGKDVWGQRLGIFGMGRIGQAIAQRARGFNMKVHYHNRSRLAPEIEGDAIYHSSLDDLMRESDYFCIACPPSKEIIGIINKSMLELLPPNPVVINISRGDIIDDNHLIELLSTNKIYAAGLDVFANEPDIRDEYRTLNNVFALPHLGSATMSTRIEMARLLSDGARMLMNNKIPKNKCN